MAAGAGRAGRATDSGITVVEVIVTTVVLTVLLGLSTSAVISMIRTAARAEATNAARAEVRRAAQLFERTLAYSARVNRPTAVGTSWYLEARTEAVPGEAPARCTQWRADAGSEQLQVRSWSLGDPAPGWTTVATGLDTDGSSPFALDPAGDRRAQPTVRLDLQLRHVPGSQVRTLSVLALPNAADDVGNDAATAVCDELGRP